MPLQPSKSGSTQWLLKNHCDLEDFLARHGEIGRDIGDVPNRPIEKLKGHWLMVGKSNAHLQRNRGINVFESPEECAVTGTDVLGLVAPSVVMAGTGDCWMMEWSTMTMAMTMMTMMTMMLMVRVRVMMMRMMMMMLMMTTMTMTIITIVIDYWCYH